ncbi:uncharacterized protein LOC132307443 [Cornus florida]|uniref:uncharacterized protein LOC132307443 n=1 Tax=Cornus florida TaxID=4283 RepID=UPI002896B940|nr:uncharacterized protein LOC132307443 [Cornus florida]
MESHQTVMLPNSSVIAGSVNPKPDLVVCNSGNVLRESGVGRKENVLRESGVGRKENMVGNSEGLIGFLEVYVHQARDIHNICIYHKQDVYAKLCLSSDPATTVATRTINGGGKNPVFDEVLQLNVRTIDSSLKCEIWMLSRVKNYLEDQSLGFALVPLSDVLIGNGKLEQEFPLSSNDLFHSPAGFVQLTLTYTGALPEVLEIPTPRSSLTASAAGQDSDISSSIPNEFDKIEFLDPKIMNENEMMVSEYFGIPCADQEPQISDSLGTTENDNHHSSDDMVDHILESLPTGGLDAIEVLKVETSPSNDLTNGSPPISVPAISHSECDTPGASKSTNQDAVSPPKEKIANVGEADSESDSSAVPVSTFAPVIGVKVEAEPKLVQQEIVDMYMKSMQQFTESLAKMKLPMDIESGSATSENTDSDEKVQASKDNGPSPRVFYGSRAFF